MLIHVDEVRDDNISNAQVKPEWTTWSSAGSSDEVNTLSTSAPAQSLDIYYFSSLVPPLIAVIADSVDMELADTTVTHRLQSLFRLFAEMKADAALDVLEVIAYHSGHARLFSISALLTMWPKSLGHPNVSQPSRLLGYSEPNVTHNLDVQRSSKSAHPHSHQFVPWHFLPRASSAVFPGASITDCHACSKPINDFGLFCPFCICAVHSSCYDSPEGSFLSHYPVAKDNTSRVAVHRFSYVQARRWDLEAGQFRHHQHVFRLVNIFTLALCGVCRKPLWGCVAQGLRCASCNQYAHSSCLEGAGIGRLPGCRDPPDSTRITIDWAVLRSSFADFYHALLLKEEDLVGLTHEEVSVYWSTLWIQLQLLRHGVASGSLIVSQVRPTTAGATRGGVDDFELHYLVKLFGAYLLSGRLPASPMLQDFSLRNGRSSRNQYVMFDWSTLLFVTSVMKSPPAEDPNAGAIHLAVTLPEDDVMADCSSYPFQATSVAHARDVLGRDFGLLHDQSARLMLVHLNHLGFLDCPDLPGSAFRAWEDAHLMKCSYDIPLGLDLSVDVETLITAIEICLKDLHLGVNEIGFLLLVRKLWPTGMSSDYASRRLTTAVLDWVLHEVSNQS